MIKLLAAVTALLTVAQPAVATHHSLPTTYIVSRDSGVLPEGIAVTRDGTIYVTSYGTGAVYRGTVRDPELKPFLPAGSDGRARATGVHVDDRGRVFVAGFDTGALFVYSAGGDLLAKRATPVTGTALNDLVITKDAVYVTDSRTGVLWRSSLAGGRVGPLTRWLGPEDFPVVPGFLNGIAATPDGRIALVADGGTGSGEPGDDHLFRIDLQRRTATEMTVSGGQLGVSDGLLLEGNRLYGVVDLPADATGTNPSAVNLAVLDRGLTAAYVVRQSGSVPRAQTPTTIARDPAGRLLWVNSQLGNPSPTAPFTVTVVPGLR
ncbi:superoxide dismutase [Kribbella sp. ALI-6-A]|uniref:superoxide dismutase n=1 Tax=Kribbella sp. ALI-6-A TaxID=1933817 RepID=UPI00097BA8AE|nr:superoxide dismutase [Kribbella sp. ALI-6-A]ONI72122.1 superoxide dismutase [Kribbella sp. ALI-6-A]